jgi:hypothetical protein
MEVSEDGRGQITGSNWAGESLAEALRCKNSFAQAADPVASRSRRMASRKGAIWFQLGMLRDAKDRELAVRHRSSRRVRTGSANPGLFRSVEADLQVRLKRAMGCPALVCRFCADLVRTCQRNGLPLRLCSRTEEAWLWYASPLRESSQGTPTDPAAYEPAVGSPAAGPVAKPIGTPRQQ